MVSQFPILDNYVREWPLDILLTRQLYYVEAHQ